VNAHLWNKAEKRRCTLWEWRTWAVRHSTLKKNYLIREVFTGGLGMTCISNHRYAPAIPPTAIGAYHLLIAGESPQRAEAEPWPETQKIQVAS
jgi:hypothetical protein